MTEISSSGEAPVFMAQQAILAAESEDAVKADVFNDIIPVPGTVGYGTVPRAIRTPFLDAWQGRREEPPCPPSALAVSRGLRLPCDASSGRTSSGDVMPEMTPTSMRR